MRGDGAQPAHLLGRVQMRQRLERRAKEFGRAWRVGVGVADHGGHGVCGDGARLQRLPQHIGQHLARDGPGGLDGLVAARQCGPVQPGQRRRIGLRRCRRGGFRGRPARAGGGQIRRRFWRGQHQRRSGLAGYGPARLLARVEQPALALECGDRLFGQVAVAAQHQQPHVFTLPGGGQQQSIGMRPKLDAIADLDAHMGNHLGGRPVPGDLLACPPRGQFAQRRLPCRRQSQPHPQPTVRRWRGRGLRRRPRREVVECLLQRRRQRRQCPHDVVRHSGRLVRRVVCACCAGVARGSRCGDARAQVLQCQPHVVQRQLRDARGQDGQPFGVHQLRVERRQRLPLHAGLQQCRGILRARAVQVGRVKLPGPMSLGFVAGRCSGRGARRAHAFGCGRTFGLARSRAAPRPSQRPTEGQHHEGQHQQVGHQIGRRNVAPGRLPSPQHGQPDHAAHGHDPGKPAEDTVHRGRLRALMGPSCAPRPAGCGIRAWERPGALIGDRWSDTASGTAQPRRL